MRDAQDQIVNRAALFEALATVDIDLAWNLLSQAASTVKCEELRVDKVNFAAAALHSMAPRDGIEALLCVQMAGVHNLAMHLLAIAAMKGQTDVGLEVYVNRAVRLLRTFTAQVEALTGTRASRRWKSNTSTFTAAAKLLWAPLTKAEPSSDRGERLKEMSINEPHGKRRGWLKNGNPPGSRRTKPVWRKLQKMMFVSNFGDLN